MCENETALKKCKNTKAEFSGEHFTFPMEVKSQEQLVHNQRKQLEQVLKKAGHALCGDLAEEETSNEKTKGTAFSERNAF